MVVLKIVIIGLVRVGSSADTCSFFFGWDRLSHSERCFVWDVDNSWVVERCALCIGDVGVVEGGFQ